MLSVINILRNPHWKLKIGNDNNGILATLYPKSSYLKNSTITSVNFHSSKGPSPEDPIRNNSLASDVMRPRDDENTLWTDSQDYGADEIL